MNKTKPKSFDELLESLDACSSAKEWSHKKGLKKAYSRCQRGDWLIWLLMRMSDEPNWPTRKQVLSVVCDIAETAFQYLPPSETRPRDAIQTVRLYIIGKKTRKDCRRTVSATYGESITSTNAAANAAAFAADAAFAAANAAANAADAAFAATNAAAFAADAANAAARTQKLKELADLIRSKIPCPTAI